MSVRRLAEPALQPASFAFTAANARWAEETLKNYPKGREQSAVILLLMRAQEQEGWVTRAAIEHVGRMLDMPLIRVLEVATFYTQFQLKPVGTRAHVQVCGTTPCMLRGSEALIEVCRSRIHHDQFHTNAEGTLSWEEVECLGACVNAPMVMIFKDTYEDLTPERLAEIIDAFAAGDGPAVPTGPQVDRIFSAPQSGLTTLKSEKAVLKSTRDREMREEARAAQASAAVPVAADGAVVPPSRAAKPTTDAAETNAAVKSPSPVKAGQAGEGEVSVSPPAHSKERADQAAPQVEKTAKPRKRPVSAAGDVAFAAPERLKGEPIGPDGKRPRTRKPKTDEGGGR